MRSIDYLENVKTSIINDVRDVAIYHSRCYRGKQAGFLSIPRQVFCYVDYLGFIAYGGENKNTVNAIHFIKEFFPEDYKNWAELLYTMWRHGTVHQYEPKSYYLPPPKMSNQGLISIKWLSNNSNKLRNRKDHLKFFSSESRERDIFLVINICQLVDDLLFSLDNFIGKMKKDSGYKKNCEIRIHSCGILNNSMYVKNRDINSLVAYQIKTAFSRRSGTIDKKGNVVT